MGYGWVWVCILRKLNKLAQSFSFTEQSHSNIMCVDFTALVIITQPAAVWLWYKLVSNLLHAHTHTHACTLNLSEYTTVCTHSEFWSPCTACPRWPRHRVQLGLGTSGHQVSVKTAHGLTVKAHTNKPTYKTDRQTDLPATCLWHRWQYWA